MAPIPRDAAFDSTLALLREGYAFIPSRCARYRSDIFAARLMLHKAYCLSGAQAAEVFYHPDRLTRRRAMPLTALRLLQDKGSVQLLDGPAHRARKQLFMGMLSPERVQGAVAHAAREWRGAYGDWSRAERVVVHRAVQGILCRAACAWAGIPLGPAESEARTRELAAMIDAAGSVGPRNWRAQLLRARAERWARALIRAVRVGAAQPAEGTALRALAAHREPDGRLLEPKAAAVELLNVLRPTVAVAWYVSFLALALHRYPEVRLRVREEDRYLDLFVQEVRRFYPFFPAIAGRVREPFEWRGHAFGPGTWMLLDLYGTNRDPARWENPAAFRPERFEDWGGSPFDFIPQGGGSFEQDHRCPGEGLTIELLRLAARVLARELEYRVPEQDVHIDLSRMPALPRSGFVIREVRVRGAHAA